MENKKLRLVVASACILLAVIIFWVTSGGKGYDTRGKMLNFKCVKCSHVTEVDAYEHQKFMEKQTEGMTAFEIMGNPNLGLKCEKCDLVMQVAIKNPQTGQVEIVGR